MASNYSKKINKHVTNENNKRISFKQRLSKINSVVNDIEQHLTKSQLTDNKVLLAMKTDEMKKQHLASLLEQAEKENKQLLNVWQQQSPDNDLQRSSSRSHVDFTNSYSTVSMVNLQYKYEELVASHQGLLKILEAKIKEIKLCNSTCVKLEEQLKLLAFSLKESQKNINNLCHKYISLKNRKDRKISGLKTELASVKEAYEGCLKLLEKQNDINDHEILSHLKRSSPIQAQFLQEVRRTNVLRYENAQLKMELQKLKQNTDVRACKSCQSLPNIKTMNT